MRVLALEALLRRDRLVVAASLTILCVLSWLFLAHLMAQMELMKGAAARMMGMPVRDTLSTLLDTTLNPQAAILADAAVNFTLVVVMWAVMMAGMMVPSAAPTILLFSALERRRSVSEDVAGRTAFFVAGYLASWGAFSVVAAAAQTALAHSGLLSMEMAATSTLLAGSLFIAAGLFEFTPLKSRCLSHCRSPLEWLPRHMRTGRAGALRMGGEHGAYCVGCCWALMLLLFVGGIMNLLWVAVIASVALVQKLMPGGLLLARAAGVVLIAWGVALLARPLIFG